MWGGVSGRCVLTPLSLLMLHTCMRAQVQAYVRAYAQHFDLDRHIRLRSRLIQLRPKDNESEGWTVLFQDLTSLKVYKVRGKA